MTTPPLAFAAGLACVLAWRAPSGGQRVVAATLAGLLLVNVGRPWLQTQLALDLAAFVCWYAITAAGVWSVLGKTAAQEGGKRRSLTCVARTTLLVLACYASAVVSVRWGHVAELPRAAFALALAAQLVALARFLARGQRPDDAQRAALILVASSVADLAGPWLAGTPSKDWHVGRVVAVATWIVVAADQARALWGVHRGRLQR